MPWWGEITGALVHNDLRQCQIRARSFRMNHDRVVVGGLQQVRPGMEVRPDKVPMPTLGPGVDQGSGNPPGKTAAEQGDQQSKTPR
jgi:hypothetical protein